MKVAGQCPMMRMVQTGPANRTVVWIEMILVRSRSAEIHPAVLRTVGQISREPGSQSLKENLQSVHHAGLSCHNWTPRRLSSQFRRPPFARPLLDGLSRENQRVRSIV
jgi:hypothetical protein